VAADVDQDVRGVRLSWPAARAAWAWWWASVSRSAIAAAQN
jgi:hypothetical protein